MKKIKNAAELLATGNTEARQTVLEILDETLDQLDSYNVLKRLVSLKGDILTIGNRSWDLSAKRNVYVIGAGKAANAMGKAFDEILGSHLTDGIIIVKIKEPQDVYEHLRIYTGGHPLPNQDGLEASLKILDLVEQATEDDLFIGLMSGGCSALMSCPKEGVSLEEEIQTRDVMLKSGADVVSVNSVCRHISRVNGGQLAKRIEAKGAEIICLLIMDALGFPATADAGEPTHFGFTQMAPDATTLDDAKAAIRNYHVQEQLPAKVVEFFANCTAEDETPKSLQRWTGYIINTLPDASNLAREAAAKRGLPTLILTNYLAGEAREAGTFLAAVAREIQDNRQPIQPPCLIVATGEVSVKIPAEQKISLGGPGQELAVSFALAAAKMEGACLVSVDTEGTDGPTDAAGGLSDSCTLALAQERKVDLYAALRNHDAYNALGAVNGKVITGNTGTNLCDLHLVYVPAKA